jgi:hypothetical protein
LGSEVSDVNLAQEAKDLLQGKEDSLFDVQPMTNDPKNNFVKMIMVVSANSVLPVEVERLRQQVVNSGFENTHLNSYHRDDGKIVLFFATSSVPGYIALYIKDFYDWVVKK